MDISSKDTLTARCRNGRSSGYQSGDLVDTALHVLLALVHPRHGYAVMHFLKQESEGAITLGPASL